MKTEIVKIIEAGLNGDKSKLVNYTKNLAKNVKEKGDIPFSNRLLNILSNQNYNCVNVEEFQSKPVDQDSRMDLVDIIFPNQIDIQNIYYNLNEEKELDVFIKEYNKRDILLENDIIFNNSLLLYGKPGCGKTTMAKYIAKKINLPIVIARLDTLVSSLLGNTAKNIRKVFEYATQRNCVLFLDEFDAIAKARDDQNELGELKRVVNSLLQNIDEFSKSGNMLIAATNHPKLLDPAVWRRFNKIYEIQSLSNNNEFFKKNKYYKYFKLKDSELNNLLQITKDFTPSDINTIINNCVKNMIINNIEKIGYIDLLKELFIFKNHYINSEKEMMIYYLKNNCTINELHKMFNYPLRNLRDLSKEIHNGK